ncbi:hypothetical protein M427DRAFT_66495 [Gonapodya prolifera JEL478]|uniref:VOC domain-containing protein n=1 Tax=Gonapodya prolifera (strain JEL478) TaxID=1344416 RepID=A0A139AVA6_GONPJ|nr:hypothetical protein M427DRAFT_66495 [Gonapodya prolifera JEL478]|eukprot:KXS20513.1 hypothetical protein M427DRAFT_66495 [Gonapodya prolifera JEL478]
METPPCLVHSIEPFLYVPKPISGFVDEFAGPVLGLKNISSDPSFGILVSPDSSVRFFLCEAPETHDPTKDAPEIRMRTTDVDALLRRVKERAPDYVRPGTAENGVEEMYGARQFGTLHKPSGICFIFYQPLDA